MLTFLPQSSPKMDRPQPHSTESIQEEEEEEEEDKRPWLLLI